MANYYFDLFQALSPTSSREARGSRLQGAVGTVCCRVNSFLKFLLMNRSFVPELLLFARCFEHYTRRVRPRDNGDESRSRNTDDLRRNDCARSINFAVKATRNSVIPRRVELVPAVVFDENL